MIEYNSDNVNEELNNIDIFSIIHLHLHIIMS